MTIELTTDGQVYTNSVSVTGAPAALLSANGTTLINQGNLYSSGSTAPNYYPPVVTISGNGGTVINRSSAQISANDPNIGIAIQGGAGADVVTNAGTINGIVALGAGNDSFTDTSGAPFPNPVNLDDGNDTYHATSATSTFGITANGGAGQDTMIVDGVFDTLSMSQVSAFEILQIGNITPGYYPSSNPTVYGASGFSEIDIAQGSNISFVSSMDDSVDLSINGGDVGIGNGSVFRNVFGSSNADTLGLSGHVVGSISLAGGNDQISFGYLAPSDRATSIDGGAGTDTITLFGSSNDVIDLSNTHNFEKLVLSDGGIFVSNISAVNDVNAGQGIYNISSANLPSAAMNIVSGSNLIIAADVVFARIGMQDAYLHKTELAAIQTATTDGVSIVSDGTVLGDVQLTTGGDYYAGNGTVQGTIYGYAGNDFLGGGSGDDRIDGGYGADTLYGSGGADRFIGTMAEMNGDRIGDLSAGDRITFTDASLSRFAFSLSGDTLDYGSGTMTLSDLPAGYFLKASPAVSLPSGKGIDLALVRIVADDFNGDGHSDVLWRNDNGDFSEWLGNWNGAVADGATAGRSVPTSWHVAGTGDFNGDGRADILWRNDSGQLTDWLGTFNVGFTENGAVVSNLVPTSWHVADTGDFNGDGRGDILWRNDSGQLTDWLGTANGGFVENGAVVSNAVPTSWHVAGTGDFNGDHRADILWRNDSGQLTDWLGSANGGFTENGAVVSNTVPTSWHVAGTGDFNGDGRADILWRNDSGQLTDWLGTANGGFAENGSVVNYDVPTSWHVAQIGDFDGDGRSDILWRNDNGALVDWLGTANGAFADNSVNGYSIVDTHWHVQQVDHFLV